MSWERMLWAGLSVVGLMVGGVGCVTVDPSPQINDAMLTQVKTVALMPMQQLSDVPGSDEITARYEQMTQSKLEEAGYQVVPPQKYADLLKQAKSEQGQLFDPTTGQPDRSKIQIAYSNAMERFKAQFPYDACAYIRIIPVKVNWGANVAEWDGVSEPTSGETGFVAAMNIGNMQGTIGALSFAVDIYDRNDVVYFSHRGGIQLLAHYKKQQFVSVPKDQLLTNPSNDAQAVSIALDPLLRARLEPSTSK